MAHPKLVTFLLRLSIASVFLYAAIAATLEPGVWLAFLPPLLVSLLPAQVVLGVFSLFQIVLSVWVLSGWKSFFSACLAALTLIFIILSNITIIDIVFRDIAIFFAALALAAASYKNLIKK